MADAEMDIDAAPPTTSTNTDAKTSADAIAVRSIEGWIIIATNIHEEASEEDINELFGEYGQVQNMHLNLDRRTGYVKGYALIEYATLTEAKAAIASTNNTKLLDQTISVDYAFVRPPPTAPANNSRARRGRSVSPGRGEGPKGGLDAEADGEEAPDVTVGKTTEEGRD